MSVAAWLAFVAASAILLAIPGPTVLLVISYALSQGRRSGMMTVAGVGLGDLTAILRQYLGWGYYLPHQRRFLPRSSGLAPHISSISALSCGTRLLPTVLRYQTRYP